MVIMSFSAVFKSLEPTALNLSLTPLLDISWMWQPIATDVAFFSDVLTTVSLTHLALIYFYLFEIAFLTLCCCCCCCFFTANIPQRKLLVQEIAANALRLVQDPFGNYVVQYVLDLCPENEQGIIIVKFVGSVTQLSTQKFSSNVIEKCLEIADKDVQRQFLTEIANDSSVPVLLNDPYGNYVMQRALSISDDAMFDHLCNRIRPHISSLRSTPCGKRIHNKLLKRFPCLGHPGAGQQMDMHMHMRHSPNNGFMAQEPYGQHFISPQHGPMMMVNPFSHMQHMVVPGPSQRAFVGYPDYGMPVHYE
jgi:hypothetical protein